MTANTNPPSDSDQTEAFDPVAPDASHRGQSQALYAAHVNPRFARALKLIGFDREYESARGAYLWDINGERVLDMLAGYGVFNIGRNHPRVRRSLIDFMQRDGASLVQMETPLLCGLLAKELKRRTGYGLDYAYFCSTGAEAVESALKFCRRATSKTRMIHATRAFHGLTTGALSLNGASAFRDNFGTLAPADAVPLGDLAALEQALDQPDVAAFFIEPIQGKGVHIPETGYLRAAQRLCRQRGVLFVADEIQTGVGRTGRFLALHHEEAVEPDVIVMSKALSGGYVPVACVLMRAAIYEAVFSSLDQAVVHSSTFGKSNFAMTAALATLAVLDEEKLTDNARRMGDLLGKQLLALAPRFEFIKAVRWRGLMMAVEFGEPKSLGLKTAWKTVNRLNADLFCQAVTMPLLSKHGILTQVAGHHMPVIKLTPPLVISDADVSWFIRAFEEVMTDLHRFPGPVWKGLSRIARNAVGSRNATPS